MDRSVCSYCGDDITGSSVNSKHPECYSDSLMHKRDGAIFSRRNVAAWLRERAAYCKQIGAMEIAINFAGAAEQVEQGAVAEWVRATEQEYVCTCIMCRPAHDLEKSE